LAEAALFPLVNPLLVGNLQELYFWGGPSPANAWKKIRVGDDLRVVCLEGYEDIWLVVSNMAG